MFPVLYALPVLIFRHCIWVYREARGVSLIFTWQSAERVIFASVPRVSDRRSSLGLMRSIAERGLRQRRQLRLGEHRVTFLSAPHVTYKTATWFIQTQIMLDLSLSLSLSLITNPWH